MKREPLFAFETAGRAFIVITSKRGANRVYSRGDHTFRTSETGERLLAVPSHRAFWFGWFAQHPDTELHR